MPQLWPGETVCILGAGPSLTGAIVGGIKDRARVIAVNSSYRLAPWADLLYGCDYAWWHHYQPEFAGLKVTQDEKAAAEFGLLHVVSCDQPGLSSDPSRIHQGGNGGYQAINLAVLLGAAKIILLGYDLHGGHWHGAHAGLNNPTPGNFQRWIPAYRTIQSTIPIINCTAGSALDAFPFMTLEAAFEH